MKETNKTWKSELPFTITACTRRPFSAILHMTSKNGKTIRNNKIFREQYLRINMTQALYLTAKSSNSKRLSFTIHKAFLYRQTQHTKQVSSQMLTLLQLQCLTSTKESIKIAFKYKQEFLASLTAFDYQRLEQLDAISLIVIDKSDLVTGAISPKGSVKNEYTFTLTAYTAKLQEVQVTPDQLQLRASSDYIRKLDDNSFTNGVTLSCQSQSPEQGQEDSKFACQFTPEISGTYYIDSPYLSSHQSYRIVVENSNGQNRALSRKYSSARVLGDFKVEAGSLVEIEVDLRDINNNTFSPPNAEDCTLTESYYTIDGVKYQFLFKENFPEQRTQIHKAGVADFEIILSCNGVDYEIQCNRCQKVVQTLENYLYHKIRIPAFPSKFNFLVEQQADIVLEYGQNLVFEITFYDRYDNPVASEGHLSGFSAKFTYPNGKMAMQALQTPGKIHFYLSDSQAQVFRRLKPRANSYSLELVTQDSSSCSIKSTETKRIIIASKDRVAPLDVVGEDDTSSIDNTGTSIYWDKVVEAGSVGRLAFTLRNINQLQLSTTMDIDEELITATFYDMSGQELPQGECSSTFGYGLYHGEYFGWFKCSVNRAATMSLRVNGKAQTQEGLPLTIVTGKMSKTEQAFEENDGLTMYSASERLDISFQLLDEAGNAVDTVLIDRKNPLLGSVTYNLTNIDTHQLVRVSTVPMSNYRANSFRMAFDNLVVGKYQVTLNMPYNPASFQFQVDSKSPKISNTYSYAYRETASPVQVGDHVIVFIQPRNIHNKAFSSKDEQPLIQQQLWIFLSSDQDNVIELRFNDKVVSSDTGLVFEYKSVRPIALPGTYIVEVKLYDTWSSIFVANATFKVSDKYSFKNSDLFLVKGIEEKEFWVMQHYEEDLNSIVKPQHYDPRFDGSLRFKLYFKSETSKQVLSDNDLSQVTFTAHLSQTTLNADQTHQEGDVLLDISMAVTNLNGDFLMVSPRGSDDQAQINSLGEGMYMVVIEEKQAESTTASKWLFTLFNTDLGPVSSDKTFFFTPSFVNITAGEPYTFVCEVSAIQQESSSRNQISVVSSQLQGIDIQNSSSGLVFYVSVYQEKVGTSILVLEASVPVKNEQITKEVTIQANPGPLDSMLVISDSNINKKSYSTGTVVSVAFSLVDRYGNNVLTHQRVPNVEQVSGLLQTYHLNAKPVIRHARFANSILEVNFTSQYSGFVNITSPLLTQTFTVQFDSIENPSTQSTFAVVRANKLKAGDMFQVQVYLRDKFNNKLLTHNVAQSVDQFAVNLVPGNDCISSTLTLPFTTQNQDVVLFSSKVTKTCTYNVQVYFFNSTLEGMGLLPCLNCFAEVYPAIEDPRRLEFLDMRDALVTPLNGLSLYMPTHDQNPTLIVIFRDEYENLKPNSKEELAFFYYFDIVETNSDSVMQVGRWQSYKSFHYLTFCRNLSKPTGCFSSLTSGRLRVVQRNKTNDALVSTQYIDINFVDNTGLAFGSGTQFEIAPEYSFLKVMNQDAISGIGYELPVLRDECISGQTYPIIGKIDIRNKYGFRRQEPFESLMSKVSIQIEELSRSQYDINFYQGNTNGTLYFTIFVSEDSNLNRGRATARLYISGQLFENRFIKVACRRRTNYLKHIVDQEGSKLNTLSNMNVVTGEEIVLNVVTLDSNSSRLINNDQRVGFFSNSTDSAFATFTASVNTSNRVTQLRFPGIKTAGSVSLLGYNWAHPYTLQVKVGEISHETSFANVAIFNITAGAQSTIDVCPLDKYGNNISLSEGGPSRINELVKTFVARTDGHSIEKWLPATSCSLVSSINRIQCSVKLNEKGIYKWRVLINDKLSKCQNCFVRVNIDTKVSLAHSILTDLSQNYYASHYGTGKFRMVYKPQLIVMKLILRDQFGNPFVIDTSAKAEAINAEVIGQSFNLVVERLFPSSVSTAQVYKVTVPSNYQPQFQEITTGTYWIEFSTPSQGALRTPIYIKETLKGFPEIDKSTETLTITSRQPQQLMVAGKRSIINFEIVDSNGFQLEDSSSYSFTYSVDNDSQLSYSFESGILGQYQGIYSPIVQFDQANEDANYQRLTSFTVNASKAVEAEDDSLLLGSVK